MAFSPVVLNLQVLVPNRFEIDSPCVLSAMDASVTSAWWTEKPDKKKVSTSICFWFLISDGFNSFEIHLRKACGQGFMVVRIESHPDILGSEAWPKLRESFNSYPK